ncbi:MAG: hypothetical protein ACE5HA_05805 [Anaerolineae bacterium]
MLATVYSVTTPLFEAPDEVWHFQYIVHVSEAGTLPVQDPEHPGPWRQEGSQPPLYYALVAPFVAPIDTSNIERITQRNPHAAVGRASADGNANFVVHTARERFPWRGAALAAHLARLLSVLLGAATVALTYLLTLEVFRTGRPPRFSPTSEDSSHQHSLASSSQPNLQRKPRRSQGLEDAHLLAIGAALLVALNPQFLFISGSINNDNLVIALATLTLVLLFRLVNLGVSNRRLVGLGIVLGLAALSKLSGLGLWVLAGTLLLALAWQRRAPMDLLRWAMTVFGIAGLIAGWWYARNWALYSDPTGLNVMLQVFGYRTTPASPLQLFREFQGLRWSFWAVFGWFNVLPSSWVLRFFDLLTLLGVAGLIIFIYQRLRAQDWPTLGRLGILMAWLAITFVSLGRWTMLTSATQGRLLFPAISAVNVMLFTGLATLAPSPHRPRLLTALALLMGGIALYAALGVIRPAYTPPPALAESQIDAVPRPLSGVVFGDQIALAGYDITPEAAQPGEDLTVKLYWQGLKPIDRDYSLFIHLVGEDNAILSQRDSYPGRGTAPTSEWQPGAVFEDTYRLPVPATATVPQSTWIAIGFYNLSTHGRLRLADGAEWLPLKAVQLVPAGSQVDIPNPVDFDLGGQAKLVGYELSAQSAHPGETIDLVLYWQALADMGRNYTVFTHLLGDDKVIWAQDDTQPLRGNYPTSRWSPGEVVRDTYHLTIKRDAPAGRYHLEVGMYVLETEERLYRVGEPAVNSIPLADLEVLPAN